MKPRHDASPTVSQYVNLLNASTLGKRRRGDSPGTIPAMLRHSGLMVTGRENRQLASAARWFTGFRYVTGSSDVRARTARVLEIPPCRVVLPAAPKVADCSAGTGFAHHMRAWAIQPRELH